VPRSISTLNPVFVAFSTEWRSMSRSGQPTLGDNGRLRGGRITRSAYPCTHCHMSFTCDAHRGRHMQASHASLNRLVGTRIEPSTSWIGLRVRDALPPPRRARPSFWTPTRLLVVLVGVQFRTADKLPTVDKSWNLKTGLLPALLRREAPGAFLAPTLGQMGWSAGGLRHGS